MILSIVLAIVGTLLAAVTIAVLIMGSTVGLLVCGDLLVFILLMVLLVRAIRKCKKR